MSTQPHSPMPLFHVEKGEGEPLLFLNGLSGDHAYWMGQFRHFARHYHCCAVDNRDVGRSGYAAEPYSVVDMALDVAALLERLALGPAHVVGLSLGGMIAQELTLARPALVRSLTLVSTLAQADDWFRGTLEAFGLIRRQVRDTADFFEAILPWWVSHQLFRQPERVAWLRWLVRQNPQSQRLDGFLRQLQAIARHDALERLGGIGCPVLLLGGEDDCVAPPRYTRQLRDKIAQAEVVLLPGIGHAAPLENPERFNACAADFLARVSPVRKQSA